LPSNRIGVGVRQRLDSPPVEPAGDPRALEGLIHGRAGRGERERERQKEPESSHTENGARAGPVGASAKGGEWEIRVSGGRRGHAVCPCGAHTALAATVPAGASEAPARRAGRRGSAGRLPCDAAPGGGRPNGSGG